MKMSRRDLIARGGAAAGVAALAGMGGGYALHHSDLLDRSTAPATPGRADTRPILVLVTLYGGNDGLNTVIPAADPAYQDARPEVAYRPEEVLDLGSGLGLNPGLPGLKKLWDARRLAIVRGVGYPEPDHSHFRSMDIWQTADPRRPQPTGWVGRWLDAQDDPMRAVSTEDTLPQLLIGDRRTGVLCPPRGLTLGGQELSRALTMLGRPDGSDVAGRAAAAGSMADVARIGAVLDPAVRAAREDEDEPPPGGGTPTGGQNQLMRQLDLIAHMIELRVPTRVYSASFGGFDTHAGEKEGHENLLTHLDQALSEFQQRIDRNPWGARVVTVVYSEFGRRVRANASQGTDHGTAGPVFMFGHGVRPGFHGAEPSLTDLDDGDLKYGVDFRSIYATLLAKVLQADPARFLGGWDKQLPVLT